MSQTLELHQSKLQLCVSSDSHLPHLPRPSLDTYAMFVT